MKHDYYLMYKVTDRSFTKYKGSAVRISELIPKTYDEIWVGVKKRPDKVRKITTFKDEKGTIIERSFDYSDGKLRNRLYANRSLNIGKNETVNSKTIKDYYIKKRVLPYYEAFQEDYAELHPLKNILWNLTDIISNHISINKRNGEKCLSQVKITNIETPTREVHSFIEYPHIIDGKKQPLKNKFLKFVTNQLTGNVKPDSIETQGVRVPAEDSYLALRAFPIDEAKELFTDRFIRERNLKGALIEVNTDYYPKDEDEKLYAAHFEPINGSINFNRFFKPYSKTVLAGIARHEVEHGWQYFLRSRYTEASTEWEDFIGQKFGEITNPKLKREAKRYTKSIKNYIALTKELEEEGKVQEYRDNYIEIKAKKFAKKEKKEYDKQGKCIRNSFKHIPKEYL